MKSRYTREKTLWTAIVFVLSFLTVPALFADEQKHTTPNTSGHSAAPPHQPAPQHQAPAQSAPRQAQPQRTAPSGGGNTHTPAAPAGRAPNNGTYSPAGHNQPGNTGNRPPANPNGTPGGTGGNRPGGYNPAGGAGTRGQGTPAANPNVNRNPGGYNPAGGGGNRNPGGYNPAGGGNRNPGGNNPAAGGGNRNPGGYNPAGNRNAGNSNRPAFRPPQGATSSARAGGGTTYTHGNAHYATDRNGHLSSYSRPGAEARFGSNGRVSAAHFTRPDHSQVYVNRGPRGERTVVTVRADHSRVVSYGPHHGYYERPMASRPGYVSRTYMYGGRPYVHVYHAYGYRGITYYRYVPPIYYGPAFYGWAWSPWRAPIVFAWGWNRDPWYGYYGGYFTPAPVYPTASLWLTDYLLAENLRMAYESRQAAQQQNPNDQPPPQDYPQTGGVTMTPEIKAAIAEEVRQQLEAERAAAGQGGQQPGGYNQQPAGGYNQQPPPGQNTGGYSGTSGGEVPPPSLDPKQRIFVVSTNLDVTATGGQNCALTPGDIILRTGDAVLEGGRIGVSVLSAKAGDCPVNSATELDVVALQEMHNQFREHIDTGLKQLADNSGKNGLPPAPAAQPRAVAEGQAPPDSAATVEAALASQQTDANQAEQEVQQAANSGGQ